ncbi:hypothetical protein E2562_013067 [Oryza meyeriana var. granulata]|uniref:Uncharacterized protein n=1 Tax=Oryza meyeriana var. granulata TaxID=110450 RepID=A0A6G1DHA9_9ORYZ|nr:hypothetical protein E2562_013067 [Oryza meyeriana var. granulata]
MRPFNVPPVLAQLLPRRAAPTSGNPFGRTMMVQPPPTVQPPPQQQPPETPEMHESRVLEQLVEELFLQRRIDAAHAGQQRPMPLQAPQQPCSDAVEFNDDGEKRSADVATTEVAPDGSATAEGDRLQRDALVTPLAE